MSEFGKGFSNQFIHKSAEHHHALARHHTDLSEHHKALADAHDNASGLSRLHHKCSECHKAIAATHKERATAYADAVSGADEETRSMLHDTNLSSVSYQVRGAADLHAITDAVDPELSDMIR
jgi:hypothetical protein